MARITEKIERAVRGALEELQIYNLKFKVDPTADPGFGDYATNAAMIAARQTNRDPKELAVEIVVKLTKMNDPDWEKIEVAGPGFVNFHLSRNYLRGIVADIQETGEKYGRSDLGQGKKILVEYSSPNIAKPFGIGHLRSTLIGDAIANILNFSNFDVIRDNHLGDWGTQFGKQIVALKRWGDEKAIEGSADPVKELVALYVKFHEEAEKEPALEDEAREWFAKLEKGDEEAIRIWKKSVEWSLISFSKIYEELGIKFDTSLGESFYIDKTAPVIKSLERKKLLKESEGAKLVFFETDLPPLMILKKDGSSLYALRDLAADNYRKETYGDDLKIINEVGSEQSLYFRQLFETEKLLGYFSPEKRVHVAHGLYRFTDGKMSTRQGKIIWLEDVLNEAISKAKAINEESAKEVGIGAIKYNDLRRSSNLDIVFNWEEVLNLEGNSGPYLQYTYVRTQSILNKKGKDPDPKIVDEEEEGMAVEKKLEVFPLVIEKSAQEYAPHHLCTYLYELASIFNAYYAKHQIIGSEAESYRLALTAAVGQVLKNGLNLLGIKTPIRM